MVFLQNYDQPMIVLGFVGMIACGGFLIDALIKREENSFDSITYKMAFARTTPLIVGLIIAAFVFATGWAIPNPPPPQPTFASVYQDCIYMKDKTQANISACREHANTVMSGK